MLAAMAAPPGSRGGAQSSDTSADVDSNERTPLLAASRASRQEAWEFNATARPIRDPLAPWALLLLLLGISARAVYFFAQDPAAQPLAPLSVGPLFLRLLPSLGLGALFAYLGCLFVLGRAKRVSPRGLWWLVVTALVVYLLATAMQAVKIPKAGAMLAVQSPSPPPPPPPAAVTSPASLASQGATEPLSSSGTRQPDPTWQRQLSELVPALSRAVASSWERLRLGHPSWPAVSHGPLASEAKASITKGSGGTPPGMRLFTALMCIANAAAAVLVLTRFSGFLPEAAECISQAGQILSSRAVPCLTVALVSSGLYLSLVPFLALLELVSKVCPPQALLSAKAGASAGLSDVSILHLLSGSMPRIGGASATTGTPEECSALLNTLIPTDVVGALCTVLFLLGMAWLSALLVLVLKFAAAFVVSEALASQRSHTAPRLQEAIMFQGLRFALRESLGSLCLISLLLTVLGVVVFSLTGVVAAGRGGLVVGPILLMGLDLGLYLADIFYSSFVTVILAASGKSFSAATQKARAVVWSSLVPAFAVCVSLAGALLVFTFVAIFLVSFGEALVSLLLSRFQDEHLASTSQMVMSLITSLGIGVFANVFETSVWSVFVKTQEEGRVSSIQDTALPTSSHV